MSSGPYDEGAAGFQPDDEVDEMFARANPNPERIGCPSDELLGRMARRALPIGDPAYEHLARCSPCFRAVRALQQAHRVTPEATHVGEADRADRTADRSTGRLLATIAATLLLVGAFGVWLQVSGRLAGIIGGERRDTTQARDLHTELDLRPYTVQRGGGEETAQRPPVVLQRGRLQAKILLPVGSEPGLYEVQILDAQLASRASAAGEAVIREFVTTLEISLDLRDIAPGRYQLAVRLAGQSWRFFPASVG